MKDRYLTCYIAGRGDSYDGNVDLEALVAKITAGAPVRETVLATARAAIGAEMDAATKVQWLKDNLDEVKSMGGDTEKAWRLFCEGRIDALAIQLDDEALEEIVTEDEEDEGDEDEEEGDEDEESEDEDEDEEDDDDDSE